MNDTVKVEMYMKIKRCPWNMHCCQFVQVNPYSSNIKYFLYPKKVNVPLLHFSFFIRSRRKNARTKMKVETIFSPSLLYNILVILTFHFTAVNLFIMFVETVYFRHAQNSTLDIFSHLKWKSTFTWHKWERQNSAHSLVGE